MPDRPHRKANFLQELKRRRVFKAVTMYAASAFIILEVAGIVIPSLGLPEWTMKLVIILLVAGFPLTSILSWIFDLTPEGIKKTDPVEDFDEESTKSTVRRKLRVSDVTIAVLLIIVGILAYPKIFSIC